MCNPPAAFVELTCPSDDTLMESLTQAVVPFSAAFSYLEVTLDEKKPWPSFDGAIPSVGITLLFQGRNQKYAERTLAGLGQSPWQPLAMPQEVRDSLPLGLSYYTNSKGGPTLGVKTGCHQAGVQVSPYIYSY